MHASSWCLYCDLPCHAGSSEFYLKLTYFPSTSRAPDIPVGRGHLAMPSAVILLPWSKFGAIPLGVMIWVQVSVYVLRATPGHSQPL